MRLLVLGAIVLSLSMTLHLHRWMDRRAALVSHIEKHHKVAETERQMDALSNLVDSNNSNNNSSSNCSVIAATTTTIAKKNAPSGDATTADSLLQMKATATVFKAGNSSYPRIAYLTYSHLNTTTRFEELVFPALETWHPLDEPYYIILSQRWKSKYQDLIANDANFTRYKSRMEFVFVNCNEGKTPEVECCKQEEGMMYMMEHYDYDWVIYLDDDNYIRSSYMRDFLTDLPATEVMVGTSGPSPRKLGIHGYLPQKSPYKCSNDPSYTYPWGQVVAYNRATLQYIRNGLRLHGLLKQCLEYKVYHDVGNAIFHWMYDLPEFHLMVTDRPNEYRRDSMGAHGIGRCKSACPMELLHERFQPVYYKPIKPFTVTWRHASGFKTTTTFRNHGHPRDWNTEWYTMPIADCKGPPATQPTTK